MARRAQLLNKVEESIRAARKNNAFSPVDELAIATLKDYARLIDDARNIWEVEGDIEPLNKALAVSGAHMTKLMAALGLTPLARGELGPKSEDGGDGIDELKERRCAGKQYRGCGLSRCVSLPKRQHSGLRRSNLSKNNLDVVSIPGRNGF